MASPPRATTSPQAPYHPSLPNPKKRGPSLALNAANVGPSKRRKGGAGSITGSATSSAHPLRQTSFPPEEGQDNGLRSPSVDSDITGVTGAPSAGGASGAKKKRGKGKGKGKGKGGRGATESVRSGGRASVDGLGQKARGTSLAADEDEDEEDDDDGGIAADDDTDRKADREKLGVLVDAFDKDQFERYEMFRRIKFRKETVRKITNFVVSQSVPPSVVLTINGYTKSFVGVLIERARMVQREMVEAEARARRRREAGSKGKVVEVDPTDFGGSNRDNRRVFADGANGGPVDPARLVVGTSGGLEGEVKQDEKESLGPLLPEHLREALRRYKRDGEGGGTGLEGVSVGLGLQGKGAARLQGKRLFR